MLILASTIYNLPNTSIKPTHLPTLMDILLACRVQWYQKHLLIEKNRDYIPCGSGVQLPFFGQQKESNPG